MRGFVFAGRIGKEILREPLAFIFCLGFPLGMLMLMTIIDQSIPAETGMKIFHMNYLAPGIVLFGFTFLMLFVCLQVSKDRSDAFLMRLCTSPMKSVDFVAGYTMPVLAIAVMQSAVTFAAAFAVAAVNGDMLNVVNVALCILVNLPAILLFLGFGILFGTLFSEKAAPGCCSIVICAAGMLGGIWMDVDALGGVFGKICHVLPFYQSVKAARMTVLGQYGEIGCPLVITSVYAAGVYLLAAALFKRRMRRE